MYPPKDTKEEAATLSTYFEDPTLASSLWFPMYARARADSNTAVVGNAAVHYLTVTEMTTDVAGASGGVNIPSLRRRVRTRQLRIQINRVRIELLISVGDSVRRMTNRTRDPHVQDVGAVMLENRVFWPNRDAVAQQSRDVVTLLAHRESAGERIERDGQREHWLPGIRRLIQRVWPFEKMRITADVRPVRPVPTVIGRVLSAMAICALQ